MKVHGSDVVILGAGMAGASLAAELSGRQAVTLLEIEDQPGRHATGRSAAMFFESYGNAIVRALTRASRHFLLQPPTDFADEPFMRRRDALIVSDHPRSHRLDEIADGADAAVCLRRIDAAAAIARVPILRTDWLAGALLDESGHDIDVARLHHAYLRVARGAGTHMAMSAGECSLERRNGSWYVQTQIGLFQAPILVNAAGAWADRVGQQAGARRIGLQPMRRSACIVPAPVEYDSQSWPMVIDADEEFYFKPDAGKLLLSPANEDPMAPCDAAAEELDIALAVDRFERATTMHIHRVAHRWAGLRSFVADRTPVVGFDDRAEAFFWLAAQGGYGIQLAPALARIAAALVLGTPVPADVATERVIAAELSPSRRNIGTGF